jgi:hypothetical protein
MSGPIATEFPTHIRKSIRDTQRLLSRQNVPADVRQVQERKLRALQIALEGKAILEKQKKVFSQYRMVRFFESKKAARKLTHALSMGDQSKIVEALKDTLYVKFFPKDSKYISLFPSTPCVDESVLAERSNIREKIFEEHGLEYQSQDSIMILAAAASGKNTGKKASQSKSSEDEEDEEDEDDEEEDDNGSVDSEDDFESESDYDSDSEDDEDDDNEEGDDNQQDDEEDGEDSEEESYDSEDSYSSDYSSDQDDEDDEEEDDEDSADDEEDKKEGSSRKKSRR